MGCSRGRRRPPRARCGARRRVDAGRALPSRPAGARVLDGALFYLLLPWRIARELRASARRPRSSRACTSSAAFLARAPARRVAHEGDPRRAGRLARGDALYGSPLRRLLNPVNDAIAPFAVRRADAVRTVSTQTTGLVRALGVEPARPFPSYVDADAFLEQPPAPLPQRRAPSSSACSSGTRRSTRSSRHGGWRRLASRPRRCTSSATARCAIARARLSRSCPSRPSGPNGSRPRRLRRPWTTPGSSPAVALRGPAPRCARGRLSRACDRRRQPGGDPRRRRAPDERVARRSRRRRSRSADALVRLLSDRQLAQEYGAAARRTGEEWGVTPGQYAAKVRALVDSVLAG